MCGPAALTNALEVFGKRVNQDDIVKLSGTKNITEGLSMNQICRAAKKLGFYATPKKTRDFRTAWDYLTNDMFFWGFPNILCVDNWSHWVTAVGGIGVNCNKVLVADAADEEYVRYYSYTELEKRWNYKKRFYGISVGDVSPIGADGPDTAPIDRFGVGLVPYVSSE